MRAELKQLFTKLGGAEQLGPSQPRLATTFVGNWGMHAAVRELQGPAFDGLEDAAPVEAEEEAEAEVDPAADPRLLALRGGGAARAALCARLRCRTLVGLKVRGRVPRPPSLRCLPPLPPLPRQVKGHAVPPVCVKKSDDEAAVEQAWEKLKARRHPSPTTTPYPPPP